MNRTHGFGKSALVLMAALCLPTIATAAPAAEQRCTELGGSCLCSEPMNWQQAGGGVYGGVVNPADSSGPGAKECGGGGNSARFDGTPGWRSVAVPNKPATAAASWQLVQQVTHVAEDGDNINWWWGVPTSTSNGTLCTRHYSNIGTLRAMTSFDHRIKVAQWFGNSSNLTQLEWGWDQSNQSNQYLRPQSPGTHGSVVSFEDCRGAWCRIEYCIDYNAGRTSWRVRISKVGTPSKTEIIGPVQQANSVSGTLQFSGDEGVAIGDVFAQCYGRGTCPTGTRHIAFGIQTLVQPMNGNFWPGAAYEVEGGSGGSTPPPPTTPPPPPTTPPPPPTTPPPPQAEPLGKPGTPTYQP